MAGGNTTVERLRQFLGELSPERAFDAGRRARAKRASRRWGRGADL